MPHGVQNEIYPLPARHFGSWHKITISSNHNNLGYDASMRKGGYVKAQLHIDALLADIQPKVIIVKIVN